jgi:hypothetical protein
MAKLGMVKPGSAPTIRNSPGAGAKPVVHST